MTPPVVFERGCPWKKFTLDSPEGGGALKCSRLFPDAGVSSGTHGFL
jgi:hypothetical protein